MNKGDILLGDRAYADYVTLACMPQQGVDVLARLSRTRKVDFRRAKKRLSRPSQDALFEWNKGRQQSDILTPQQWEKVAEKIAVRIIRFYAIIRGRKQRVTRVTTLLDPVAYPAQKLIALYARRWNLELALRHVKTTMAMEQLRCKTPEMAEKEVLAYLVALRPGRKQPRAVKRRPKPYPLLNKPRQQYKETPHRSRYRKNKTVNKSRA